MRCRQNVSLKHLNSFAVEAHARQLLKLESEKDLVAFASEFKFEPEHDLVLGGGSNVLFAADVEGTVVLNRLRGRRVVDESSGSVLIEACAGENWHELVQWSLDLGLAGLENLSLIPGLAGAAPMQNIGAYGVELSDVLESVRTIELSTGEARGFPAVDCQLSYRDSRFKSADKGRYLITAIRLRLKREFLPILTYEGISRELHTMGVSTPTARQVSEAVIRIRRAKLPDPDLLGNAGSFFKNPVVSLEMAAELKHEFKGLPVYPVDGAHSKLGAAWMIEHCHWKGHREKNAGVSEQHALVLINHGNASGSEILDLANRISASVKRQFGIELQPEPRIFK